MLFTYSLIHHFETVPKFKEAADNKRNVTINPLPDMPISGSSNLAANKDMISKIWTKLMGIQLPD